MTDPISLVLTTAFRNRVSAPNVEAGFERFQEVAAGALNYGAFRDALDACLRDGLIFDPVRLREGALQCHWILELTPAGQALARTLHHSPSPACGRGLG